MKIVQSAIQLSPQLRRSWFKQSKVVDENGNPKVVYHGSKKSFTEFRNEGRGIWFAEDPAMASLFAMRSGTPGTKPVVYPVFLSIQKPLDTRQMDPHHWYTAPDFCKAAGIPFARWKKLMEKHRWEWDREYLEDQVRFHRDDGWTMDGWKYDDWGEPYHEKQWVPPGGAHPANREWALWMALSRDNVVAVIRDLGYDGVLAHEKLKATKKMGGDVRTSDTWMVLDPSQVRSALS